MRFLIPASPPLAIVIAHTLVTLWRFGATKIGPLSRRERALAAANYFAVVALVLSPAGEYFRHAAPFRGLESGTRLLRRFGQTRPPNVVVSVLSDWTWGDHILYYTGLPAVASPFILSGADSENVEAARALLSEKPDHLYRTMRARHSRYLLITDVFDPALAAAGLRQHLPRAPAATRLLARDISGWSRLRLIDLEPGARLFEFVKGARLTGQSAPYRAVTATLQLRAISGDSMFVVYHAISSPDGRYEIRVSQPTTPSCRQFSVIGLYRIAGCEIEVTESQIHQGSTVPVACSESREELRAALPL